MTEVRLAEVGVVLDRVPVLHGVDAVIPSGSFAAVVGPSGSGKTTLLRSIAGLVRPSSGRVTYDGVDVTHTEVRLRDVGMVFQSPVMFTDRSVRRNVGFPLELRRQAVQAIRDRVDAETRAMHMEHLLLTDPAHLSRGEQQLVQIARTMVRAPRLLLLDEPFAPLDAHRRNTMRAEIRLLQDGYGITTLMATNDPDDVAALADHVLVLGADADDSPSGYTVVQAGSLAAVENDPVSLDVAYAVAPLWTVRAGVERDGPGFWLVFDGRVGSRLRSWSPDLAAFVGREVVVGFRRGDLTPDVNGELRAELDRIVPGGTEPLMCRLGRHVVYAAATPTRLATVQPGRPIRLHAARHLIFDVASGRRLA